MKYLLIVSAIFLMATSQAHAQNIWIPADRFEEHANLIQLLLGTKTSQRARCSV